LLQQFDPTKLVMLNAPLLQLAISFIATAAANYFLHACSSA
jgi:hypothetical protein